MQYHKIVFLVSFTLIASSFLAGQTLIGISGGVNLSKVIDNASNSSSDQVSDISGKLSYSILLEIKGRKPKKFHPGASIMFYQSSYDGHAQNSGYLAD